mmetsp:Transcript_14043/g.18676  ORF Transcript_14043/g.18676 Transcript_14043/m.18676 type:complete len:404 (-) Transcript_14043:28-1239(-)
MDRFGQLRSLEYLRVVAPDLVKKAIVVVDGDVKGDVGVASKAREFTALEGDEGTSSPSQLLVARCYTHIIKNVFKFMDSTLPKVTCACTSKSTKNHRCTAPLPRATTGHISKILSQAMLIYVPPAGLNLVVSEIELEDRRLKAIEFFRAELDVCLLHLRGIHDLCKHGASSKGEEKYFCCGTQVTALEGYFSEMKKKAPELLSRAGRVHIQHCESNNALVARIRPKGDDSITAVGNFLAETIGYLSIMELQLAHHDFKFSYLLQVSNATGRHFGIGFQVDAEKESMRLEARVRLKQRRMKASVRSMVAAYRARKRAVAQAKKKMKKVVSSGSYASGGSGIAEVSDIHDGNPKQPKTRKQLFSSDVQSSERVARNQMLDDYKTWWKDNSTAIMESAASSYASGL